LLIIAFPALRLHAAHPGPVHAGVAFPRLSAKTLTGKSLELPAAALGKPAVLLFSFSRTAGKDAHLWKERLARDFSSAVPTYDVVVLESVPKLFRGLVLSGIRSGMPLSMQDRTVVLYQDEKLWKTRLTASDNNRAYVVLLAPDGQLCWSNATAYTASEYARLKNRIDMLIQLHP
jgi:hypothetical protein